MLTFSQAAPRWFVHWFSAPVLYDACVRTNILWKVEIFSFDVDYITLVFISACFSCKVSVSEMEGQLGLMILPKEQVVAMLETPTKNKLHFTQFLTTLSGTIQCLGRLITYLLNWELRRISIPPWDLLDPLNLLCTVNEFASPHNSFDPSPPPKDFFGLLLMIWSHIVVISNYQCLNV